MAKAHSMMGTTPRATTPHHGVPVSPRPSCSQNRCEWGESFRLSGNQAYSNINHRTRDIGYEKETEATDGDSHSVKDSVCSDNAGRSPILCTWRGGPEAAPQKREDHPSPGPSHNPMSTALKSRGRGLLASWEEKNSPGQ